MIKTNAVYQNNDPDSHCPRTKGGGKVEYFTSYLESFILMDQLNYKSKQYEHYPTVRKGLVLYKRIVKHVNKLKKPQV